MKKYIIIMASALLLTGYASMAQNDDAREKSESAEEKAKADAQTDEDRDNDIEELNVNDNDNDEIVIKKKNDNINEKLVIEIKKDRVTINGKPIEEFSDDAVSVRKRRPNRYNLIAPSSPFRFPRGNWSLEDENMYNGNADANGNQPFLGVLTEGAADGAKVVSVTENSAAAKAGLKKDDIITKINDKPVSSHQQLTEMISDLKPEEKVSITYRRGGKENKANALLGKKPSYSRSFRRNFDNDVNIGPIPPVPPIPPMEFNFDDLRNSINFERRPRLGIKAQDTDEGKGVKVLSVDGGSAAEKAGLKENDVITAFDGKEVNSASELSRAARDSKDKSSLKVQLKRNGKTQDIELKVPKNLKTADL